MNPNFTGSQWRDLRTWAIHAPTCICLWEFSLLFGHQINSVSSEDETTASWEHHTSMCCHEGVYHADTVPTPLVRYTCWLNQRFLGESACTYPVLFIKQICIAVKIFYCVPTDISLSGTCTDETQSALPEVRNCTRGSELQRPHGALPGSAPYPCTISITVPTFSILLVTQTFQSSAPCCSFLNPVTNLWALGLISASTLHNGLQWLPGQHFLSTEVS